MGPKLYDMFQRNWLGPALPPPSEQTCLSCHPREVAPEVSAFKRMLQDQKVSFVRTPSIITGVPCADKLHAWRLPGYRRIAMIDCDVLALQTLDPLFDSPMESVQVMMGHHAYDVHQGKTCGIPLGRRGVGGLIVLKPQVPSVVLPALVDIMRKYSAHDLVHYAEQTAIACYFHERQALQTLDCGFFYDVSNEAHVHSYELGNCFKFAGVDHKVCRAIAAHVEASCFWKDIYSAVHLVHFKGKSKPWSGRRRCRNAAASGRLVLMENTTSNDSVLHGMDDLVWDDVRKRCFSRRWRLPVGWSKNHMPVEKVCCSFRSALQAEWYAIRATSCDPSPEETGCANSTHRDGGRNKTGTMAMLTE